jgi:nitroimidazol reductase NimA-like FMN-containing flavoprotein (pyridoxamine 5'-phosphate oxidase superfamily)
MVAPVVTRPRFPKGYVDKPTGLLAWKRVERQIASATHYWLCSMRPNGRPHSIPKWAVWVDGRLYFDGSPETRHAKNIAQNPFVSVHLESGEKAVIMDGTAREMKPSQDLAVAVARSYSKKYAALGYSPKPDTWDAGGLFEIVPRTVIAWSSFAVDPTKFVFPDQGIKSLRPRV